MENNKYKTIQNIFFLLTFLLFANVLYIYIWKTARILNIHKVSFYWLINWLIDNYIFDYNLIFKLIIIIIIKLSIKLTN